ncbi:MAG TPA: Sec-independent protein translocase subunit TatB [Dermatophilaceae bacterium]|nr:Sec-independent protein translocase subunit TatB [Dermatophilaceae bacterium]
MFDINGWEFIVLIVLGIVILGPERLPEYAAKLARLVKQLRVMADGARVQLREQLGPEFEDVNWRQYDPRQYDPRRIVREALLDPSPTDGGADGPAHSTTASEEGPASPTRRGFDASAPVPWDADAT